MLIALHEPEIPPNTGNIARLCAAFDIELHLIEPLGFKLEDRYLRRAGLDYWPHVKMWTWPSFADFQAQCAGKKYGRLALATTKGSISLSQFHFEASDALVFGSETRGLPDYLLSASPFRVRIPGKRMEEGGVRSLNLSTACGIFLYAALNSCGMLDLFS